MVEERDLYRVLDANLNRLREGMRVVEEYRRLVADEPTCVRLKELRHRLRELIDAELEKRLLAARRAGGDVGAMGQSPAERRREEWPELLKANLRRAQEAARVLEEYGKLLGGEIGTRLSAGAKELRFALYELEPELLGGRQERVRRWFGLDLGAARRRAVFYLVVDKHFYAGSDLMATLESLLASGGIGILQWRQKRGTDGDFLRRARKVRELCRRYRTPFVVNDRPDIAWLVAADGLHLGQSDLPLAEARRLVGPEMIIGRSTHSLAQARAALAEGADYLGFGPIFATPSKERPDPTVGIAGLGEMLELVGDVPVVAIGGLDESNLAEVVTRTRPPAVAVIRAVLAAPDPVTALTQLKAWLDYPVDE